MRDRRVDHDLYRGALGIAVLALLSDKQDHGYAVACRLAEQSDGALQVSEGAIYPLLHRLEEQGLLSADWVRTEKNRNAKLYTVTPRGRAWLEQRSDQWRTLSDALGKILQQPQLVLSGGQ